MHGKVRTKTWTMISNTINSGDSTFDVLDSIDWEVGEEIVVASTSFNHHEAEKRTITSINGTTITVDEPFSNKHYGGTESIDNFTIDVRAEVGLLSRNIKMMGD